MTVSVPLGDLADVVSGGTPKRSDLLNFGGDVPWVKIGDMLQGTVTVTDETITQAGLAGSSAKLLPAGTLLLSIFATIGRTAVLGTEAATNQAIAGITILDPSQVDRDYLRRFLERSADALARQGRGVAQANINLSILRALPIPLPPLDTQRRIVAVLDAADALRVKRRDAVVKLNGLVEAQFLSMFVAGSGEWPVANIESLAEQRKGAIRTGPFGSQLLHEEFVDEGIAVLGIDNVVQNRFGWAERRFITPEKYAQLERYTVRPGDVLVTIMGTCGRAAVVPESIPTAINTKHLCCISTDQERCLPDYLWGCLRFHPAVLHQLGATHGAVMPGLNMGRIKEADVPVPPLSLQAQFVSFKEATERALAPSARSAEVLDDLFGSLQQRAFRGEL